jgi:hypothetical protein
MFKIKMRLQECTLGVLNKMVIDKEGEMKKIIVLILIIVFFMISTSCTIIDDNGPGPAPNSGDAISDGSGF